MSQNLIIPRNDLAIRNSYQVEVPLTNVGKGAQIKFLRNDILNPKGTDSVIFTGWETYTNDFLAKSESGRDVVTPVEAGKIAVTLAFKDKEFITLYPYIGLISAINFGMIRRLDRVKIDITKSYVTILDNGIGVDKSAIFNFMFNEK